jgi:hypothetical protein
MFKSFRKIGLDTMQFLCARLYHLPVVIGFVVCLLSVSQVARAQKVGASLDGVSDVEFPKCDAVINVKLPPYNAKGDGVADDTLAIQAAIDDLMGQHRVLYFPEGEYLVSKTIRWSKKHSSGKDAWGHNWIQGKHPRKTTIRLKDGVFTGLVS